MSSKIRPVFRILNCEEMNSKREIETGDFAPQGRAPRPGAPLLVIDWNIDRGLKLSGILDFLASTHADLILLQEVDFNARRTRQLNIAREISRKLQMNYVFGLEFQELTQGSAVSPAYHGQATLSPWPLSNPRIVRFRSQSAFWRPHWFLPNVEPFQKRVGGRMALVSEVSIASRVLLSYNLHLESRGDDTMRCVQLDECLRDARRYRAEIPVVLAGDFNLDASRGASANLIKLAQFYNALGKGSVPTTPSRFLFEPGRAIDWIFTRGNVRAENPRVHSSISASDHYPLSVNLEILQSD